MIRTVYALAVFFSPRRVAKFLGFYPGRRRARKEPQIVLFLAAAGAVTAVTVACLAYFGAMEVRH